MSDPARIEALRAVIADLSEEERRELLGPTGTPCLVCDNVVCAVCGDGPEESVLYPVDVGGRMAHHGCHPMAGKAV